MKLGRMAKSVASVVNTKRKEKGLLPRPVTPTNVVLVFLCFICPFNYLDMPINISSVLQQFLLYIHSYWLLVSKLVSNSTIS
jgi:hypothetical protein